MAAQITGVFDDKLRTKITDAKILVVGAGGIGCEILKNLVLSGFKDIEIVDLDTIDVSNLNRQFLFHKEHVGKSKAEVARKSALSFNPFVRIKAYHDSITTSEYGVSFFKKFSVVLNALDNQAARNHVNRMCLSADVPLIESGTSGYNGQVELIKRGQSKCYECTPKTKQKTFPGCTIRNTPSEPIHCIVWAKHLFNQLFGEDNADEDVSPDTADPEAAANAGDDALSSQANEKGNIDRVSTKKWAKNCGYDPEKLFNKFFGDDIKYLLSMANLWKTRTPPKPMEWNEMSEEMSKLDADANAEGTTRDQKLWSLPECASVFAKSIDSLKSEFSKLTNEDHLVWDKDDKYAMDFVAACANIRCHIFGIAQNNRFTIKSMAGNIIPAIATTNAITAGIVVMRAFRVLMEEYEKCQSVYVRLRPNARNQFFIPDKVLDPPNPSCYVCSAKPEISMKVDTSQVTIKYLRDEILIKTLNMTDPDVVLAGKGVIVISSEEGETDCNNNKLMKDLQIVDGAILKVDDFFQNYVLDIFVFHKDLERDDALPFEIIADPSLIKEKADVSTQPSMGNGKSNGNAEPVPSTSSEIPAEKKVKLDEPSSSAAGLVNAIDDDDDDDDIILMEDVDDGPAETSSSSTSKKRKTTDDDEPAAKRSKVLENNEADDDDDLIMLDD